MLAAGANSRVLARLAAAQHYFDVFLMLAVVTLLLTPVVLLMKRSVAEKGAHVGHE
jgi:MFS transporter, DHA2 family, multidrug resistance protein